MGYLEIKSFDVEKIHNEINQLSNVRIVATLAAVSAIGLAVHEILKFSIPLSWEDSVLSAISMNLLWGIVFALQVVSYSAWERIRLYAAYLRFKRCSAWEDDWHCFRFGEIEDKKLKKLRDRMLRTDSVGFCSIFDVAFALIFAQIFYMSMVLKEYIDCGIVNLYNIKYTFSPFFVVVCVAIIGLKLKKIRNIRQHNLEMEMMALWCSVLTPPFVYKQCGTMEVCSECSKGYAGIHKGR